MEDTKDSRADSTKVFEGDIIESRTDLVDDISDDNEYDQFDMYRMGKKQELRRNFEIFSM